MGSLGEFADALDKGAQALRERGALVAARAAGEAYLGKLGDNTPVLTGELKASERVDRITGNGERAVVTVGAHTIYAAFREKGGVILPHDRSRGGWVGAPRMIDGHLHGHHSLHWGGEPGVFAMKVTQVGSHYFARTNEWAYGGGLDGPCQRAISQLLRDSGL